MTKCLIINKEFAETNSNKVEEVEGVLYKFSYRILVNSPYEGIYVTDYNTLIQMPRLMENTNFEAIDIDISHFPII